MYTYIFTDIYIYVHIYTHSLPAARVKRVWRCLILVISPKPTITAHGVNSKLVTRTYISYQQRESR